MNTCAGCKYYDDNSPYHLCRRYPKALRVDNVMCGEYVEKGPSFRMFNQYTSKLEHKDIRYYAEHFLERVHSFRREYVDFWVKNMEPKFLHSDDPILSALNCFIETTTDFLKICPTDTHSTWKMDIAEVCPDRQKHLVGKNCTKFTYLCNSRYREDNHPRTCNEVACPYAINKTKPSKPKRVPIETDTQVRSKVLQGWNECCDAWEKYLEEKIEESEIGMNKENSEKLREYIELSKKTIGVIQRILGE